MENLVAYVVKCVTGRDIQKILDRTPYETMIYQYDMIKDNDMKSMLIRFENRIMNFDTCYLIMKCLAKITIDIYHNYEDDERMRIEPGEIECYYWKSMAYRPGMAVLQDGIWVPVVTVNWEGVGKRRVWHPAYGEFIHVGFFRHMWEPEFRDSDDELMAICRMGQLNQTFDPNTKLTSEFMLAKLVEVDVWKLIWGLVDAIKEKDNSIKIDCSYRGRDNYGYHDDDDSDGRVDGILFEGDCRDETVALVKLLMTRYGVTGSDINIMKRRYSHGLSSKLKRTALDTTICAVLLG
jgi:hypothetical protein